MTSTTSTPTRSPWVKEMFDTRESDSMPLFVTAAYDSRSEKQFRQDLAIRGQMCCGFLRASPTSGAR